MSIYNCRSVFPFFFFLIKILIQCVFLFCCITPKISFSLHLLKRKKERSVKKAGGEALEKLETQLRERAETLGLSVEQKSKAMKQRDRKVSFTTQFLLFRKSLLAEPELEIFIGDSHICAFTCLRLIELNSLVSVFCTLKCTMEMLVLLRRWSLRLSTVLALLCLSIKTM